MNSFQGQSYFLCQVLDTSSRWMNLHRSHSSSLVCQVQLACAGRRANVVRDNHEINCLSVLDSARIRSGRRRGWRRAASGVDQQLSQVPPTHACVVRGCVRLELLSAGESTDDNWIEAGVAYRVERRGPTPLDYRRRAECPRGLRCGAPHAQAPWHSPC